MLTKRVIKISNKNYQKLKIALNWKNVKNFDDEYDINFFNAEPLDYSNYQLKKITPLSENENDWRLFGLNKHLEQSKVNEDNSLHISIKNLLIDNFEHNTFIYLQQKYTTGDIFTLPNNILEMIKNELEEVL